MCMYIYILPVVHIQWVSSVVQRNVPLVPCPTGPAAQQQRAEG